ncbi:MAG: hypothetical protein FWB91_00115 [Defluviitaleaceae bacterium]|nr:hypothetical protein [Defluviitaleaceae bacterium]
MKETTKNPPADKKPPVVESVYHASELADAAWQHFDFAPELVMAALKLAKKEKCTLTEAKTIVKAFSERKVK